MKLLVYCVCFLISSAVSEISKAPEEEKQSEYWRRKGQSTLHESLRMQRNENVARNVVFFLGDGMGVTTTTAMRIYKGQKKNRCGETELLSFDTFPHLSLSKTYGVDRQTSDSANTATAYLCGVKANYGTAGVDGRVTLQNCSSAADPSTHVSSILQWAQEEGKWTGFVTSTRVTHASPSALYAHTASRDWEGSTPDTRCEDIARQLIHNEPGRSIRVILGGGRKNFIPAGKLDVEGEPSGRNDSLDLLEDWVQNKKGRNASHRLVFDAQQLREIRPEDTEYLMGLFHSDHMPFVSDRPQLKKEYPTLTEMTEKAIEILSRSPKGFFLFVEGGKIDMAHHYNLAQKALEEGVEFDETIQRATEMVDEKDTLVVVTADHSHTFTVGGDYPLRGSNILGIGGVSNVDNMTFTTLGYHNGPGYKKNSRDRNLTAEEALKPEFAVDSLIPKTYATHGAEDVAVYAKGPMAHLFHGVHEQSYIPHAMAYASCIGSNKLHCNSAWSAIATHSSAAVLKFIGISMWTYLISNHVL